MFVIIETTAQAPFHVLVKRIELSGNKKTNNQVILRELTFSDGDFLPVSKMSEILYLNESTLINTGLFNSATVTVRDWDRQLNEIIILIDVVESWYLFPAPIFDLADRNFNEWWVDHNHSFKRINFGIRFAHYNFTGNKDKFLIHFQEGFTQKFLFTYERPAINAKRTLGLSAEVWFDQKKEFAYETRMNKLKYHQDNHFLYRNFIAAIQWHYRPRIKISHDLRIEFQQIGTNPIIQKLNTSFFRSGNIQKQFRLVYILSREARDNRFYPTSGNFFQIRLQKEGFGIFDDMNKLNVAADFSTYLPISSNINLELTLSGQKEFVNENHPYSGLDALGFGNTYLRGYEYYVINGTDYVISKNSLRFRFISTTLNLKNKMPLKNYRDLPVTVWISTYSDMGYVHSSTFKIDNPLTNRLLCAGGLGLDFILYNRYVFQIQYSFNHRLENGLFFHASTGF